jgi:hypothetical protein
MTPPLGKCPEVGMPGVTPRQTELCETFPGHVVCAWPGTSEDVAKDHNLQPAASGCGEAQAGMSSP